MQAGLLRSCSQGSTGKSLALAHTCTPAVLPEVGLVLELHAQVSPCISSVLQSLYGQLSTRRGECCGCAGAVRGLDRAHIRARNGPHPPCLRPADALCGCRSLPPPPLLLPPLQIAASSTINYHYQLNSSMPMEGRSQLLHKSLPEIKPSCYSQLRVACEVPQ